MSVIAEDVFKAPRAKKNYMKTEDSELWSPRTKRRRRTKDDFVKFCNIVLAYAQYDGMKEDGSLCQPDISLPDPASHGLESQEYRSRHNSSPLDSGGSTAESDGPSDSSNNSIISYIDDNGNESIAAEDDSHDDVTCFCGKPFAGRPMIECNSCFTWVHLSCAKIRKTNIPETFVCQPCRDGSSQARKSDRHGNQKQSYSPTFP